MRRRVMLAGLAAMAGASLAPRDRAWAQEKLERRKATLARLGTTLSQTGPVVHIDFKPATNNIWAYVGVLKTDLRVCDSLETIVGASDDDTIYFMIYPSYKGGYINLNKARNAAALEHEMLRLNHKNFMFSGVDDASDIYFGFQITLESGYPPEAIRTLLYSTKSVDDYVGRLLPFIDGRPAA